MSDFTPKDVEHHRKVTDKATPGPWVKRTTSNEILTLDVDAGCRSVAIPTREEDARFIAIARNAMPAMLDTIERLQAENETLKREARSNHASAKKRAEWSKKHRAEIKRLQATCLDAARKLCEATEKRPTI